MKQAKLHCRKLVVKIIAFAMVFAAISPVLASENFSNEEKSLLETATSMLNGKQEYDVGDAFGFDTQLGAFTILDTSSFYNAVASLDDTAFGKLTFEVPTIVESSAMLNLEYSAMMQNLIDLGYGKNTELVFPEFDAGYSTDITAAFSSVFGDLSGKFNMSTELPDGWSMKELMAVSSQKRNEISKNFQQSEIYQSVLNSVSTGQVIVQAGKTLTTPELKSAASMSEILKESALGLSLEWSEKEKSGIQGILDKAAQNEGGLDYQSSESIQDLFETAVGKTNTWLDASITNAIDEKTTTTRIEQLQASLAKIIELKEGELEEIKAAAKDKHDDVEKPLTSMRDAANEAYMENPTNSMAYISSESLQSTFDLIGDLAGDAGERIGAFFDDAGETETGWQSEEDESVNGWLESLWKGK